MPTKWSGGWINCWSHVKCTRIEDGERLADAPSEIFGFDALDDAEQKTVTDELRKKGAPAHLKTIDPKVAR